MIEIGTKIKIRHMNGEPDYTDKVGTVEFIGKDFEGFTYYRGSWGGLSVYPHLDDIVICE